MTVDSVREYCLSKKGSSEDFPFDQDTLVFKVMGKMFALVPLENWERGEASINLKCDPEYAIELREQYESIEPGFHMSKVHWNSVYLYRGEIGKDFFFELIDHSYDKVVEKMTKKDKAILKQMDED